MKRRDTLSGLMFYGLGAGTYGPRWWLVVGVGAALARFVMEYRAWKREERAR